MSQQPQLSVRQRKRAQQAVKAALQLEADQKAAAQAIADAADAEKVEERAQGALKVETEALEKKRNHKCEVEGCNDKPTVKHTVRSATQAEKENNNLPQYDQWTWPWELPAGTTAMEKDGGQWKVHTIVPVAMCCTHACEKKGCLKNAHKSTYEFYPITKRPLCLEHLWEHWEYFM